MQSIGRAPRTTKQYPDKVALRGKPPWVLRRPQGRWCQQSHQLPRRNPIFSGLRVCYITLLARGKDGHKHSPGPCFTRTLDCYVIFHAANDILDRWLEAVDSLAIIRVNRLNQASMAARKPLRRLACRQTAEVM